MKRGDGVEVPDAQRNALEQCMAEDASSRDLDTYLLTVLRRKKSVYQKMISEHERDKLKLSRHERTPEHHSSWPTIDAEENASLLANADLLSQFQMVLDEFKAKDEEVLKLKYLLVKHQQLGSFDIHGYSFGSAATISSILNFQCNPKRP
ncbi:hypothetical protein C8J56DRAFT_1042174 [Mycena floridula]|nr:hypothetical protein C8J56DRAFT_1042174 [Mycena floridula]